MGKVVLKGKMKVVEKVMKKGTEVPLVLFNADDVDKYSQVYKPVSKDDGDKTRAYEVRLTAEQYAEFVRLQPKVRIKDLTAERRVNQRTYHQKRRQNGKTA